MKRWWPWVLAVGLAAGAGVAGAQSPADAVVQQLREQGYVEFAVSRTLLGRVRVVALSPDGEQREIVFNPATGEILRDYSEAADGSVAPRVLDRPDGRARPQGTTASPSGGEGRPDVARPDDNEDGNRGHGNDEDGTDSGNPGRGHGNGGAPGGNGNNPSRGGGNGNGKG